MSAVPCRLSTRASCHPFMAPVCHEVPIGARATLPCHSAQPSWLATCISCTSCHTCQRMMSYKGERRTLGRDRRLRYGTHPRSSEEQGSFNREAGLPLWPKMMKKLTGRAPQGGSGMEPIEIWAYQPKMMMGMGKFNQAVRKGDSVDERLKNLIELKGSQMIGCEFCVDLGSQICRNSGLSDEELLALPNYRTSDLFTDREKVALDYASAVMRTPVEVTDELFARMKAHFTEKQMVEITAHLTLVNLDRFNAAFGIGSAGFSDGMVCLVPDRPVRVP